MSRQTKAAIFAVTAIISRVAFFVLTPIWLDFFHGVNETSLVNSTHHRKEDDIAAVVDLTFFDSNHSSHANETSNRSVSPYFVVLGQWVFSLLVFVIGLVVTVIFFPGKIRKTVESSYPKKNFVIIGVSQGLSSLLTNFALSGSRTPPYLQAILANFALPIQFLVRFAVLRKRPTLVKAICAAVVIVCEFVCLIPTIFPSLESDQEHKEEGGSTGRNRFLWPFFFVLSMFPFAVANSIMERSVQSVQDVVLSVKRTPSDAAVLPTEDTTSLSDDGAPSSVESTAGDDASPAQLDLIYFSFWYNLFVSTTLASFFWLDILPVFGTSASLADFGSKMWFDFQCLFGQRCPAAAAVLGWSDFTTVLLGNFAFAGLMRYSEGANFVMIVVSLRTPLVFLFWTLFVEQPLSWKPHVYLSTWLSIGAIVVMVICIVVYNRTAPEVVYAAPSEQAEINEDSIDRQHLLDSSSGEVGNINAAETDETDNNYLINGHVQ